MQHSPVPQANTRSGSCGLIDVRHRWLSVLELWLWAHEAGNITEPRCGGTVIASDTVSILCSGIAIPYRMVSYRRLACRSLDARKLFVRERFEGPTTPVQTQFRLVQGKSADSAAKENFVSDRHRKPAQARNTLARGAEKFLWCGHAACGLGPLGQISAKFFWTQKVWPDSENCV